MKTRLCLCASALRQNKINRTDGFPIRLGFIITMMENAPHFLSLFVFLALFVCLLAFSLNCSVLADDVSSVYPFRTPTYTAYIPRIYLVSTEYLPRHDHFSVFVG